MVFVSLYYQYLQNGEGNGSKPNDMEWGGPEKGCCYIVRVEPDKSHQANGLDWSLFNIVTESPDQRARSVEKILGVNRLGEHDWYVQRDEFRMKLLPR